MFSRQNHETPAVLFPPDWSLNLKQVLLNIYGDKCLKDDKSFQVFGFSYPSEVLLIISYISLDKHVSPLTLFLSSDLISTTKTDSLIDTMFDSAGVFFDSYFAANNNEDQNERWDDYILDWEETEFGGNNFFAKITRENIDLTIEANRLLGE